MPAPKILVIPGSLRTGSHNARLAALAAKELALAEAEVTRISLEDYPLPLFDADLAVVVGHAGLGAAAKSDDDGASGRVHHQPGISASVTPLLKNAIDWVSRVREGGEPTYAAFKNRVFASVRRRRASGGVRSMMALRQILELGCGALVIPEQVRCRAPSRRSTTSTISRMRRLPRRSRPWRAGWSNWRSMMR